MLSNITKVSSGQVNSILEVHLYLASVAWANCIGLSHEAVGTILSHRLLLMRLMSMRMSFAISSLFAFWAVYSIRDAGSGGVQQVMMTFCGD